MDRNKTYSKAARIKNKTDWQNSSFKLLFLQQRHRQLNRIRNLEELQEISKDRSMKTGKEDSKEAYENVLDIKGETDNMNLYKSIDSVFQELGICKGDEKMLKVMEYKLSDLTLNSNSKGSGSPQIYT